uniref:4-nitrophenylphosphatase n=1 Tax=Parascaris univalens TaxID=6257 RepID=A0A915B0X2_PARUN
MSMVENVRGYQLIEQFDAFLFDADGVLWLGGKPVNGAVAYLRHLVDKGKKVFIITNNSTKTIADYAAKCKELGFDMIQPEQIISPAKVVAHLLSMHKSDLPVYLVGSAGLQRELMQEGIESFGVGPDPVQNYTNSDFIHEIDVSRPVRAVVVSYDVHINYVKIMKAINYIEQPGVKFIATNEDATFPGPNPKVRIPGAGTNVMAVQYPAGKEPVVIGKPARPIFDYICEKFGVVPERTIMIGDRCDTDIKFGRDHGMFTMLVGTGINSMDDVKQFEQQNRPDLIPHYFTHSLKHLLDTT